MIIRKGKYFVQDTLRYNKDKVIWFRYSYIFIGILLIAFQVLLHNFSCLNHEMNTTYYVFFLRYVLFYSINKYYDAVSDQQSGKFSYHTIIKTELYSCFL